MGGSLKRVVTGAILIPIVLYVVLYASVFWLFAVSSVLCGLALLEYNNLSILKIRDSRSGFLGVLAGSVAPLAGFLFGDGAFMPLLIASCFLFFTYGMLRKRDLKDSAYDVAFRTLGVAYIAIPISYLVLIGALEGGRYWIVFLLFVIWANDTFALAVGKTLGRTKLLPEISPKKTMEGAIGGLAGGAAAAYIICRLLGLGIGALEAVVFSVIIGIIGMIGDLAESLLKRSADVKDSGTLIPGHGGVLDRIDSLIFPVPVVYYYLIWHLQAV